MHACKAVGEFEDQLTKEPHPSNPLDPPLYYKSKVHRFTGGKCNRFSLMVGTNRISSCLFEIRETVSVRDIVRILAPFLTTDGTRPYIFITILSRGGDFDDLYPDVCVEGLKKDPF